MSLASSVNYSVTHKYVFMPSIRISISELRSGC